MALTRKARSGSASHASTSVHAPAWTTTAGRSASRAPSTAVRSSTASAAWSAATTSRPLGTSGAPGPRSARRRPPSGTEPPSAATRSRPSWPPAPVTRTLTPALGRRRPGSLGHRGPPREGLPPRSVRLVPPHGLLQPGHEGDLRAPPELALDLGGVEQVPAIVARTVGHELLERRRLAEQVEHEVGDLLDARLDPAADVVRLAHPPPFEHRLHRPAVVHHVEPLAAVL